MEKIEWFSARWFGGEQVVQDQAQLAGQPLQRDMVGVDQFAAALCNLAFVKEIPTGMTTSSQVIGCFVNRCA